MLTFKKHILSQITKRQEQDNLLMNVEEEIIQKEIQYNEELNKEVSIHDDDEIMKQELENNIYKNKNRINDKVE